ncbi:UDP-N-acetylglucosamine 2-epimerase [Niabella aquatica]
MKICAATGTRAEYGLLKPLMESIKDEPGWNLQILGTGAHFSPEFGLTYTQIEKDGFCIDKKVEMLLSADTPTSVIKSMGLGMIGYADALEELNPDFLIILGDRYEMLSVATAALILKIPIIHLHGGEVTEGAYDDAIRHSITKMSHLHFASTEEYRGRIIQLGERPEYVFNVGAIGIDNIKKLQLLSKEELEKELDFSFKRYNYQVTFHPATLDSESSDTQFGILLNAIKRQKDSLFIFTKSNADTKGRIINQMIDDFVAEHPENAVAFTSLGTLRFLSVLKVCDAIIGNSSSGILEAPSLHTATINIGERQKGRIQAESVLNTKVNEDEIAGAILMTQNVDFKNRLAEIENPYGTGNTTKKIMNILRGINPQELITKKFYDIK